MLYYILHGRDLQNDHHSMVLYIYMYYKNISIFTQFEYPSLSTSTFISSRVPSTLCAEQKRHFEKYLCLRQEQVALLVLLLQKLLPVMLFLALALALVLVLVLVLRVPQVLLSSSATATATATVAVAAADSPASTTGTTLCDDWLCVC